MPLRLLGGFALDAGDGGAPRLPTRKTALLLALLALAAPARLRREQLCAAFWPDREEPQARNSLRQGLAAIRQALGALPGGSLRIESDVETVGLLGAPEDVDTWQFDASARQDPAAAQATAAGAVPRRPARRHELCRAARAALPAAPAAFAPEGPALGGAPQPGRRRNGRSRRPRAGGTPAAARARGGGSAPGPDPAASPSWPGHRRAAPARALSRGAAPRPRCGAGAADGGVARERCRRRAGAAGAAGSRRCRRPRGATDPR